MLRRLCQPVQNGIFFVPFDPCYTAHPVPFCHEGQGLYDFFRRRPPTIEQRPFGFREGRPACLTSIPLSARFGLTKLDDIGLTLTLRLTIVRTDFIWTKIAYLRKSRHLFLLVRYSTQEYISYLNNTQ